MVRPRGASRRRFVLVLIVLTAVTLITLDNRSGRSGPIGAAGRLAHTIVSPLQRATSSVASPIGDWWSGMIDSGSLKRDNRRLRADVARGELIERIAARLNYATPTDLFAAIGFGDASAQSVANRIRDEVKHDNVVDFTKIGRKPVLRKSVRRSSGVRIAGVDDVLVRIAKCCTPVPGDEIVGYISLGKGITIHRGDCPNVRALMRNPERFTPVDWEGGTTQSFRVQIAVDSWDRSRLLEDVARTFAEHGANIVSYGGVVEDQMAKNWYVAEVGDVKELRSLLTALRNIEAVFDAYRVTPTG